MNSGSIYFWKRATLSEKLGVRMHMKGALVAALTLVGAKASSDVTCPMRTPDHLTLDLTLTPNC